MAQIIKKLKPAGLRKDITEPLKWIGAKGHALRDGNLKFYKKVKQAAIEQENSNRLYHEVCSKKSSSMDLDILMQRHEPLAFLSGTFNRSQKHWSVIEKEAFPIVEAVERLRQLLLRDEGLRLFTDHGM